jgi:hypothetical protein
LGEMTKTMYNPEEHLEHEHPDVTVHYCCLGPARAAWLPKRRLVLISDDLDPATRRSVMAHEVEHLHEDSSHCEGPVAVRQEIRVDRHAAVRLISIDELVGALFLANDDRGLANELTVTPHMIHVRFDLLTVAEQDYIAEQLWSQEASA